MQCLEASRSFQEAEHLLESVEQSCELESIFIDDGKKVFCIHEKLKEIYEQECEKSTSKIPIKPCYILEKLVTREKLNTLIVNLFNKGFSIIYRVDNPALPSGLPSESDMVAAQAATMLVESPQWPYGFGSFLSQIEDGDLPPILADYLDQQQAHLFYSGCVIAEIRDYRGNHGLTGSPGSPSVADTHSSTSQIYTVRYILLRPTTQSILADVDALTTDERWMPNERIALEKELVHATAEPLCLDPSPSVFLQTNSLQQRYRCLDNEATRRHLNKYTQENLIRRRLQSQHSEPSGEYRTHSFMEKRPSRFRQSDIRKSQQAGRHTTLPYNNINNNNILSNGAVLHSNNTIPVFNNNKTNVTQNVAVNRKRKLDQPSSNNESNTHEFFERLKTKIKSASSIKDTSSRKFSEIGLQIFTLNQDLILPVELSIPETSATSINELVNKFARTYERPEGNKDYTPQIVDEYLLEGDRGNGRIRVKLSILQRPSTAEYLGEQYVDRDLKDSSSTEKKGHTCRFILGTRQQANRFIQQFTDSFRQDFPVSYRIKHLVPGEAAKIQNQTTNQTPNHNNQSRSQIPNPNSTPTPNHHHHAHHHHHTHQVQQPSTPASSVPPAPAPPGTPRANHVANQQLLNSLVAAAAAAQQPQQSQPQHQQQSSQLPQQQQVQQQVTAVYPSHLTNGTMTSPGRAGAANSQQPQQIQSSVTTVVHSQPKARTPMINPAISALANTFRNTVNQFEQEEAAKKAATAAAAAAAAAARAGSPASLPMVSPPTQSSIASHNAAIVSLLKSNPPQQSIINSIASAVNNKGNQAAREMTLSSLLSSSAATTSGTANIARAATVLTPQHSQQTQQVRVNISALASQLSSPPPPPPPTRPSPQQQQQQQQHQHQQQQALLAAYSTSLANSVGTVTFTTPQPTVAKPVNSGVISTGSKRQAVNRNINLVSPTTSSRTIGPTASSVPSATPGLEDLLANSPCANDYTEGSSNSYIIEKHPALSSSANAALNAQGQGSPSYAALPSTPSPKGPFPSAAASPLAGPSSAPSPGGVTPAANLRATQRRSVLASLRSPMATISGLQNVQLFPGLMVPISLSFPSSTAETITQGIQQQSSTNVVTTNVVGLSNALAAGGQQVLSLPVAQLMASKTLSQQGLRTASANNVIATQGQVNMSATATQPIQVVNALQRPPRGLVAASAAKQQTSSHARGLITTQRHALKNSVAGGSKPYQLVNALQRPRLLVTTAGSKQATARGVFTTTATQRQGVKTNAGVAANVLTTNQVVTLTHQQQQLLAIQRQLQLQAKAAAGGATGVSSPPTAVAASNVAALAASSPGVATTISTGGKPRRRSSATAESSK